MCEIEQFEKFWQRYPALWLALNLLIGAACLLAPSAAYLFLAFPLLFRKNPARKLFCCILLIALSALYTNMRLPSSPPIEKKAEGTILFSCQAMKPYQSAFFKGWTLQGIAKEFIDTKGTHYKNIPCSIILPGKKEGLNGDYFIEGKLKWHNRFSA